MHHHNQPSLGGQPTVMPAHMNSQNMQQQMHQQTQQTKSQNNLQSTVNNRNSEQPFASALRSLAKQSKDVKDDDIIQQGGVDNKNSNNNQRVSEKEHEASRQANASLEIQFDNRPTDMRNLTSPQPPEKKV